MKAPWLYVTDLDGTLLSPGGKITPWAAQTLRELQDKGASITVASGRNLTSIKQALEGLEIRLPLISSDGALISTWESAAPLFAFTMDSPGLGVLLERLLERGFSPLMDVWDGAQNYTAVKDLANPAMMLFKGQKTAEPQGDFRHVSDLRDLRDKQILSVTVMDIQPRIGELDAFLEDLPQFKRDGMEFPGMPGYHISWIQNRDARKEKALEKLMELTGYPRERVMVFGDELNDLGMFQIGCHGVAVANARDELKNLAHRIIGPHTQESVPDYIRSHFLGI